MKKLNIKISLLLTFLMCLTCADLKSQSFQKQDSLIRILKITSFPIRNPPPLYIVEINNDMTISFYNNLPENFSQHQSELIKNWIVDSTTIILDSTDFIDLEETIIGIDLKNIDNSKKRKSESGIEVIIVGGSSDDYIIETSNQTIKFGIGANNENDLPDSITIIRNIIEKLEDKYKPVR